MAPEVEIPADAGLLARARRGDADAFMALVQPFDGSFRRLAFRLLRNRDRMDDALQDAYVRAFRGLASFGGRAALSTWLYRIVYNACLDELRRTPGSRDVPLGQADSPTDDPADAAGRRLDLAAALAALPAELRAVVLLIDVEGLEYEEVAAVLAVPPGTVASRLSRARSALRTALADSPEEVHRG